MHVLYSDWIVPNVQGLVVHFILVATPMIENAFEPEFVFPPGHFV
jgi:hypothetical protein